MTVSGLVMPPAQMSVQILSTLFLMAPVTMRPPECLSIANALHLEFLVIISQFYYSSVRLHFQRRVFSRSAFFKMAKWILSALPFFFLSKTVKFSKRYSQTAL